MNQTARVLIALAAGIALGALTASVGSDVMSQGIALIAPIGTMWTNAIRMTVVPLVLALVITGIAGSDSPARIGKLGARAIPLFLLLLVAGGLITVAITTPVMAGLDIAPEVAASLREAAASSPNATPPAMPSMVQRILEIIPVNPFRAAVDAAMLPLVFFAVAFGIALTRLETSAREPVVSFFRSLGDAMLVLVQWILFVAPIGIFALALGLGERMGAAAAGALIYYIVVLSGALLIFTGLLYPFARLLGGVSLRSFALAAAPAQAVALSSRSSLASLPAIIAGARQHLNSPPYITGFALPLAVSVFRVNVPIAWVVGVLFLSRLYGVPVDAGAMLGLVAVATFLSFSVPGIPSASLFLLAPVLVNMGLPAEGAAVLIAVDAIPDMFKTNVNVTAHMTLAAILGRASTAPTAPAPTSRPVAS